MPLTNIPTKTAALIIALLCLILTFIPVPPALVGVTPASPLYTRLTYHFFHAGAIHCLLNLWCFLSCLFLAHVGPRRLIAAFTVATLVPPFVLTPVPTIGLSAVCYALLGAIMTDVRGTRPLLRYNLLIAIPTLLPLLILPLLHIHPFINVPIHIYAYLAAALLESLTRHILRRYTPRQPHTP